MARNLKRSLCRTVWKNQQIDLEAVKALVEKFPTLRGYGPEWKGKSLYLVEKGVKDNIAGRGEWKVARFKPEAVNADKWTVFWYDSSGRWKWEPLYGEGNLEECLKIVSQNEMGLFLG